MNYGKSRNWAYYSAFTMTQSLIRALISSRPQDFQFTLDANGQPVLEVAAGTQIALTALKPADTDDLFTANELQNSQLFEPSQR